MAQDKRQGEYRAHLQEMAAAYALGALDDESERNYFEDLIAARDSVAVELLGDMFQVSNLLGRIVPQVDAPPLAEESLRKKIYHTPKSPDKEVPAPTEHKATAIGDKPAPAPDVRAAYVPMKVKPYIYGLAALFMMLIIALSVRLLNQKGPDEVTVLHLVAVTRERDSLRSALQARNDADSIARLAFSMLQERDARIVTLAKAGKKDVARVYLFFSPANKLAVLSGAGLPSPPEGKNYHLWQISEGETHGVGRIDLSQDKPLYDLPTPKEQADAFALTLEDSVVSSEPKGSALYSGVVPKQARR
jgi:hypothetical protein